MFGYRESIDDVTEKLLKMTVEEQLDYLINLTRRWNNEPEVNKLPEGAMCNASSKSPEECIHDAIKSELILFISKLKQIYEERTVVDRTHYHQNQLLEFNYIFKTSIGRIAKRELPVGVSIERLITTTIGNSDLGIILNHLSGGESDVMMGTLRNDNGDNYITISLEINPYTIPNALTCYRNLLLVRKKEDDLVESVKNINEVIAPAMATLNELKDLLPIFKKASGYITKLHDTFIKPKGDDKA